jgi:hypothetical protein
MKSPKPRNTAIDAVRLSQWRDNFSGYVPKTVTEARITAWLRQFSETDKDLAARVLDTLEFYSGEYVGDALRKALRALPGWHKDANRRKGKWRFVEASQASGTSAGVMLHRFRVANGLDSGQHNALFITPSHLTDERLGPDDTLVYMDDVIGSGKQMCDGWNDFLGELSAGAGKMYYLVIAAFKTGRDKVHSETDLEVRASHLLGERYNFFAPECPHFSPEEKEQLLSYCKRAWKKNPKGIGECGLGVVFFHRCPNVTIPVLHFAQQGWKPLFPRHA